jgi:hypothetical protein
MFHCLLAGMAAPMPVGPSWKVSWLQLSLASTYTVKNDKKCFLPGVPDGMFRTGLFVYDIIYFLTLYVIY